MMKLTLCLAAFALALRYPGLIAPVALAFAAWYGMIWLARVNPRGAVLIYCRALWGVRRPPLEMLVMGQCSLSLGGWTSSASSARPCLGHSTPRSGRPATSGSSPAT
jgi:hypothetical protein